LPNRKQNKKVLKMLQSSSGVIGPPTKQKTQSWTVWRYKMNCEADHSKLKKKFGKLQHLPNFFFVCDTVIGGLNVDWPLSIWHAIRPITLDQPGNTNWRGTLSTVDLHIKLACFCKEANNVCIIKSNKSKHWLVQGGQPYRVFPFR
jgi:hypothetical protein